MKIAAATSCSDEGAYLLEWVAHHFILGVRRFYIFTHNNPETPAFVDAREKLEKLGCVTFYESIRTGENRCFQMENFCRARDFAREEGVDWLWCADLDEYLVLTAWESLPAMLCDVQPSVAQVSFNWLIYGSDGEESWDGVSTHFDRFRRIAPVDCPEHENVKSIVRPNMVGTMHLHLHEVNGQRLGSSLMPARITGRCITKVDFMGGHVAHFSLRSRAEYEAKQRRGYASAVHTTQIDEAYWAKRDRNDKPAPSMRSHNAILKALLESWRAGAMHSFVHPSKHITEHEIPDHNYHRNRFRPCS